MIERNSTLASTARGAFMLMATLANVVFNLMAIVAIVLGVLLHAAFMNSAGKD